MNKDIAEILKGYIATLSFADKVGGLVKAITFKQENGEEAITKTIPVDCGVTHNECLSGKYIDLMPNTKYKSVMYFEDNGTQFVESNIKDFTFQSNLKLICWLNLKKLGKTDCSKSALAIANILNIFPTNYFNSSPYTRIQVQVESEEPKTAEIFSKYTYDEEKIQYLMYPFDYFALNISVRFTIPKACITDWTNENETCDE